VKEFGGSARPSAAQLQAAGAHWTAREIAQQPQLWQTVARQVASDAALAQFLAPLLETPQRRILLTGAGTSSFIGECLAPPLTRRALRASSIATTDIVASPDSWLTRDQPTLLVHFARSGNSPESLAALRLAEVCLADCAHLIITCNAKGELYRNTHAARRAQTLLLPEASNDQGFAMTSSFSSMLLAAAMALKVLGADALQVERLARLGELVHSSCAPLLNELINARFERVVYLGSNELKGLAHEAALKMLELTDGRVVSFGDSPLGFRHGPKTILNGSTLVVMFLSNEAYCGQYELDLLRELREESVAGRIIALTNRTDLPADRDTIVLDGAAEPPSSPLQAARTLADVELCLPYVVFAQLLAMLRSLSLGLTPDAPNAAGTVNRVVQGVSIYPYGPRR
jgi:tagatose-6-phosphate ketose/aldose isomerase